MQGGLRSYMDLVVGAVVDGKVTGIMKFGAFVSLPGGKSGLVHISEIAYSYVNEVSDFLKEGQEVKVKVIGVDENGRINLTEVAEMVQPEPAVKAAETAPSPPVSPEPLQSLLSLLQSPPLRISSSSSWLTRTARFPESSSIPTESPTAAEAEGSQTIPS